MRHPRPLLAAHGLTRRFGSHTAVAAVDLEVATGEVVGLIGANGAGKTTLIRLALGLLRPSEGGVRLFGERPSLGTRARLGYVSQGLGLYRDLTVAQNLAFTAAVYGQGIDPGRAFDHAPDLAAVSDRLVGELSLGIRRRVAFLSALSHAPDLLVLDEPTSGVDPLGRARLWGTIRATAEAGAGVLVTTHNLGEAAQCDRLVLLSAGCVVAEGTPTAIVGDAEVVQVDSTSWAQALDALDAAGLTTSLAGRSLRVTDATDEQVESALITAGLGGTVTRVRATLEERFVALAT